MLNWTTVLVALCEIGQACNYVEGQEHSFRLFLEKIRCRPDLVAHIPYLVRHVCLVGATGSRCYCTRVVAELFHWVGGIGWASSPLVVNVDRRAP